MVHDALQEFISCLVISLDTQSPSCIPQVCCDCEALSEIWKCHANVWSSFRNMGAGIAQSVQCLTTDCTTGVWSSVEAFFFSSVCVQTISEAHPASYPVGTRCPFLVVKCWRCVTVNTHTHQVMRWRMS